MNSKSFNLKKNKLKIIQIIAIGFSLIMLCLAITMYFNFGLDEKYGVASQGDIEAALFFAKITFVYILFILFVVTMTLIKNRRKVKNDKNHY
jgi:hypothetical protein